MYKIISDSEKLSFIISTEKNSFFLCVRIDLFCNEASFAAFATFTNYMSENLLSSKVSVYQHYPSLKSQSNFHNIHPYPSFWIVWLQTSEKQWVCTSADLAMLSADTLLAQGWSYSGSAAAGELDGLFTQTNHCLQFKLSCRA